MHFTNQYASPLGGITLASNGNALIGLWFDGQKKFADVLDKGSQPKGLPIFDKTIMWLDIYFSGKNPDFTPEIEMLATPFRKAVLEELLKIPFGKVVTYGEIAKKLSSSPRAVGNAVGSNPISLIIPCHRVMGSGGNLTGYAGGIERKLALLKLEGIDTSRFCVPKQAKEESLCLLQQQHIL